MADQVTVTVRSGVRRVLGKPYMVREIERRCDRIRRYALFTSPYASARYARSWGKKVGLRRDAAWGRVSNVALHAWFVENGTRNDDGSGPHRGPARSSATR